MSNIAELRKRNLRLISDNISKLSADQLVEADTLLSDATRRVIPTMQQKGRVYGFLGDINKPVSASGGVDLPTTFWKQTDNRQDPDRTCFSSTLAMIIEALDPNVLETDDEYVKKVLQLGDTIYWQTQIKALASFGFIGSFTQKGKFSDLDAELDAGYRVALGILHRGPLSNPSGGGHWLACIGRSADRKFYKVNDPYGSVLDGYSSPAESGRGLWLPVEVLKRRWTVEGDGSGWMMKVRPSQVSKGIPNAANDLNWLMESYSAKPYPCDSGWPTISVGVTHYENGKPVRLTDPPITEQRGRELYLFSANKVWATITDTPYWFEMTNNQRGTLFLFGYNLGWEYGDEGFDTLNTALKTKDWGKVPDVLKLYIKSAGKPSLGLYRRRLAEGYLWQGLGAQESYNKAWKITRLP